MLSLIFSDDTASSNATIPATETTLKTTNIPKNSFKKVIIECTVHVIQTGTSAAQNNTFKVKQGSTALKTYTIGSTASAGTLAYTFRYAGEARDGGAITVSVQGAGADANTNTKYHSMYIYAQS